MPLGGWATIGLTVASGVMGAESSKSSQKAAERARQQQEAELARQKAEGQAFIDKAEAKRKPYEQMVQDYMFTNKADVKTANVLQRQADAQRRNIDRSLATAYSPGLALGANRQIGMNLGTSLTAAQIQEDDNRTKMAMNLYQQTDPLLQARLALSNQNSQGMQNIYSQDYSSNMRMAEAGAKVLSDSVSSLAKTDWTKVKGIGS
jgi:hypothetical protein